MILRALSMVLVLAVAVASAGTAAGGALDSRPSPTAHGAVAHLALCPTTRNGQQAGRHVEGRSSAPALALPGLLPAATELFVLPGSFWMVLATPSSTRLGSFACSGRSTRGPPGRDSTSIES